MGIRPQGRTLILGGTGPMDCWRLIMRYMDPLTLRCSSYRYRQRQIELCAQALSIRTATLIHYLNAADAAFDTLMALRAVTASMIFSSLCLMKDW